MKTLIVTRPNRQAPNTIKALEERGYKILHAPIQRSMVSSFNVPDEDRALIVTSQNGVRYGLASLEKRSAFIYAVGAKTAQAALAEGFLNVHTGPGTAKGLIPQLVEAGQNHGMAFSHLCGENLAFNLADILKSKGVDAETVITYRMVRNDALPEEVLAAIDAGEVDGVLFHSALAARGFEELLGETGHTGKLANMDAYAFSSRVESELIGPWRSLSHAIVPDERTLFALIDRSISSRDFEP